LTVYDPGAGTYVFDYSKYEVKLAHSEQHLILKYSHNTLLAITLQNECSYACFLNKNVDIKTIGWQKIQPTYVKHHQISL